MVNKWLIPDNIFYLFFIVHVNLLLTFWWYNKGINETEKYPMLTIKHPSYPELLAETCPLRKVAHFIALHNFVLHTSDFMFACVINGLVYVKGGPDAGDTVLVYRLDEYVNYINLLVSPDAPENVPLPTAIPPVRVVPA